MIIAPFYIHLNILFAEGVVSQLSCIIGRKGYLQAS